MTGYIVETKGLFGGITGYKLFATKKGAQNFAAKRRKEGKTVVVKKVTTHKL